MHLYIRHIRKLNVARLLYHPAFANDFQCHYASFHYQVLDINVAYTPS